MFSHIQERWARGADPGVQAVSPPQVTLSHQPVNPAAITFRQACSYRRSFHQMAPTIHGSAHPIPAHYVADKAETRGPSSG